MGQGWKERETGMMREYEQNTLYTYIKNVFRLHSTIYGRYMPMKTEMCFKFFHNRLYLV